MYVFLDDKYYLQFLLKLVFMVNNLISSFGCNYCMNSKIPFIHCSQRTVVHVQVSSYPEIHLTSHNDANGIIPGSNMKMTEKHDAEN